MRWYGQVFGNKEFRKRINHFREYASEYFSKVQDNKIKENLINKTQLKLNKKEVERCDKQFKISARNLYDKKYEGIKSKYPLFWKIMTEIAYPDFCKIGLKLEILTKVYGIYTGLYINLT
jgi:hypothetical protein